MANLTVIEAIRDALDDAMAEDEKVILLGEDIGRLGGVFRTTKGLYEKYGASRVIDTPLSEGGIVGASLGLALSGLKPVPEIQFLGFTAQAFHQIGPQAGRFRQRSRGRFAPQITIRSPFGGGIRSPEFHSDAIEAYFVQCPGMKIVMPSNPADAKGLLLSSIRDPDPVLFCEPDRLYRLGRAEVPDGDYEVPLGAARRVRDGSDITFVAWSAAVELCLRAAQALESEAISAAVLDLRTLVPLDVEGLVQAVAMTGRCIVVHEAPLSAGFGAEVIATLVEEAYDSLKAPVRRVAAPDIPYPPASMEDWYLPSVERVIVAAQSTLGLAPAHAAGGVEV